MRRQQLPAVAIILSFAFLPLTDRALAASGAEPPYASKRARQSRQRALFILICRGLPQAPGLQSYPQHRSCRSPSLAKPSSQALNSYAFAVATGTSSGWPIFAKQGRTIFGKRPSLNLAFRVGFMVGNFHRTIYGAILALVGIAQVVWSNTRQIRT
jgi:hypothetical protein